LFVLPQKYDAATGTLILPPRMQKLQECNLKTFGYAGRDVQAPDKFQEKNSSHMRSKLSV
jgi:hypothetical protein